MYFKWLCLFLLFFSYTHAGLSKEERQKLAPYLIPNYHPLKPSLDALFSASRVILNLETLEQAGFRKAKPRKFTKLIVTSHPAFPGYIFKLYLDAQRYYKDQPEYHFWLLRAQGVEKIRKEIKKRNISHIFKTPLKWIYELPEVLHLPEGYYVKYTILIEEDMGLVSDKENIALWGSAHITYEILDQLYSLLKTLGLRDCAKPDNIPFSADGSIAFIDTQTFGSKKVRYEKLTPTLSQPNQIYWRALTK